MSDNDASPPPADPQIAPTRDDYNTHLRIEPALERRHEIGLLAAVLETIQQILFNPAQTAAHLRLDGWRLPTVFLFVTAFTVTTIRVAMMSGFTAYIFIKVYIGTYGYSMSDLKSQLSVFSVSSQLLTGFVFTLLITLILTQCGHGILVLMKGASHPFVTTYRWSAYCAGATSLAALVPIIGFPISLIWFLVVWTIGLQHLHATNTLRVVAAMMAALTALCVMYFSLDRLPWNEIRQMFEL